MISVWIFAVGSPPSDDAFSQRQRAPDCFT
jgi:hypothetical protein